ncbi:hypothetical protein Acsp05_26280 [Actinokineospora sp. NBRC 105648]|nr:hypothetical protein Acsp05_26280 [Actinokineospora sp. NBRC 105648]
MRHTVRAAQVRAGLDWLDCLRVGPLGDRVGTKRGEKGIPTTEASLAVASPHTKAVHPIEHKSNGCCVPARSAFRDLGKGIEKEIGWCLLLGWAGLGWAGLGWAGLGWG